MKIAFCYYTEYNSHWLFASSIPALVKKCLLNREWENMVSFVTKLCLYSSCTKQCIEIGEQKSTVYQDTPCFHMRISKIHKFKHATKCLLKHFKCSPDDNEWFNTQTNQSTVKCLCLRFKFQSKIIFIRVFEVQWKELSTELRNKRHHLKN